METASLTNPDRDKDSGSDFDLEFMEKLPGPVRAAILLLALGERDGAPIWQALTDPEVRTVAMIMAHLGSVSKVALLKTAAEFVQQVSASDFAGNPAITEKLLLSTLPRNRAKGIIEEIKVPTSPDLWDRLAYIRPEQLSVFLKNEYPQTAAVVLSYLRSEQAARVLARLPTDFATDVVDRMLRLEGISPEVMEGIEEMLKSEFVTGDLPGSRGDPIEKVAHIFNSFEPKTEGRFLAALDSVNRNASQKLRALMFLFEDLGKIDQNSAQVLMRAVERDVLMKALKGATTGMREFFLALMSQRAQKSFMDDMETMGPIRLRDVDEAQRAIINLAKDLAAKGEILLGSNSSDDEMIV